MLEAHTLNNDDEYIESVQKAMKKKKKERKKLNFKRTRRVTQKNLCLSWEMSRSNNDDILDDNGIDGERASKRENVMKNKEMQFQHLLFHP